MCSTGLCAIPKGPGLWICTGWESFYLHLQLLQGVTNPETLCEILGLQEEVYEYNSSRHLNSRAI